MSGSMSSVSDMNTLRYFFNLGVEYFRISANMQQQHQQVQQPQTTYLASSPMPQLIPGGGPTPYMNLDHGGSFVTPTDPPPRLANSSGPTNGHQRPSSTSSASSTSRKHGKGGGSGGGAQEAKSDSCEMSSDVSDYGCNSCGEGGQSAAGDDDPDTQMELATNRTDEDSGSTQGEEAGSEKGGVKTKGKRKYYMYGNHKLIKPIKDIPPRFAMLLAENSAAKARCEGPPIYIPMSHVEMMSLEQQQAADMGRGLNADAQCFYPSQGYDTMMMDENGTLTSVPPPMMVPPPSMLHQQSATSGQNPASGAYSCLPPSSSTSAALPPPPVPAAFSRSLSSASNASVRTGDGSLLSLLPASQGKGPASSGPEGKRPEEFARPSSSHKACSDLVASVSPLSVAAPPFPSPTRMPPLAPPMHATGHVQSPTPGGGKQCFYVYPSHSAGFLPATPPLAQSHAHGALSQGQVVYVMNPQGYGPVPPCTTYQPTYMAPPAHTMGMPCPPVAVQ